MSDGFCFITGVRQLFDCDTCRGVVMWRWAGSLYRWTGLGTLEGFC